MSDLQFKFDNETAYGGTTDWTVPVADMPDYPYSPGTMVNERQFRADGGQLWSYRKYKRRFWDLNWVDISDAAAGTIAELYGANKDIDFFLDVNDGGGTIQVRLVGDFTPTQPIHGLWGLTMRLEEV